MQQEQNDHNNNHPAPTDKNSQETVPVKQPTILVPQQGEIKNNDQDPGAGNRSLANEGGGKDPAGNNA